MTCLECPNPIEDTEAARTQGPAHRARYCSDICWAYGMDRLHRRDESIGEALRQTERNIQENEWKARYEREKTDMLLREIDRLDCEIARLNEILREEREQAAIDRLIGTCGGKRQ